MVLSVANDTNSQGVLVVAVVIDGDDVTGGREWREGGGINDLGVLSAYKKPNPSR